MFAVSSDGMLTVLQGVFERTEGEEAKRQDFEQIIKPDLI